MIVADLRPVELWHNTIAYTCHFFLESILNWVDALMIECLVFHKQLVRLLFTYMIFGGL